MTYVHVNTYKISPTTTYLSLSLTSFALQKNKDYKILVKGTTTLERLINDIYTGHSIQSHLTN